MEITQALEDLGYTSENVHLLSGEKVRYTKTKDKNGRSLYIDLEESSFTFPKSGPTHIEGGLLLQESKKMIAPDSLVRGSFSCVQPETQAVAVECEGGVCIRSRENNFNLQERNFSASAPLAQYKVPRSCPVLKYKEIVKAPQQMERSLQACSERILSSEMKFCDSLLEELPIALRTLDSSFERFLGSFLCKKKELLASLKDLEAYRCDYEKAEKTCSEKYDIILWNIRVRREKLEHLLILCRNCLTLKEQMVALSTELDTDREWLEKEYRDLACVIPPSC